MRYIVGRALSVTRQMARGTATMMSLAVMLALIVGLTSAALAGTGVGARLDLGKTNTVSAVTSLVGGVAGPSLKIDNDSTGTGATALGLQVEPGKAPMKVNPGAGKATNLNADKLDGKSADEIGVNDLEMVDEESALDSADTKRIHATCPAGKVVVATGYHIYDGVAGSSEAQVADVVGVIPTSSSVEVTAIEVQPTSVNWGVDAYATCATGP